MRKHGGSKVHGSGHVKLTTHSGLKYNPRCLTCERIIGAVLSLVEVQHSTWSAGLHGLASIGTRLLRSALFGNIQKVYIYNTIQCPLVMLNCCASRTIRYIFLYPESFGKMRYTCSLMPKFLFLLPSVVCVRQTNLPLHGSY